MLHLLIGADKEALDRVCSTLSAQLTSSTTGSDRPGRAAVRVLSFDKDDPDAVESLVRAASSRPLFAPSSLATLDLSDASAAQVRSVLVALASAGSPVAVALSRRPAQSLLSQLAGSYQEHTVAAPSPAQVQQRLAARCAASPVTFAPDALQHLAELARSDASRAFSVVDQLELAGADRASLRQVRLLSGQTGEQQPVWKLADAVVSGQMSELSELSERSDPVAAWAALGRLLCQLLLVHAEADPAADLPSLPGGAKRRLQQLLATVKDPERLLVDSLVVWVEQDRRIKADPKPPAQLLAAATQVALLFRAASSR